MADARRLLAAAFVLTILLTGCGAGQDPEGPISGMSGGDDDGFHGAVLDDKYTVPEAPLTDTDGSAYSLVDDTDRPLTLVFFGYTNCPDICQIVMSSIASSLTRLEDDQRKKVDVVFVTTDPARDDEARLRAYLDRFDPSFIGLTGDLATIVDVGDPLKVAIEKGDKLPTGGYDVTHGTQVTAIDDSDTVPIIWTQGTSSAQFAEDITHLLEHGVDQGGSDADEHEGHDQ